MINSNAVLDPTAGYLLELRQLLKIPDAKTWRDAAFNKLSRLVQGIKKQTIKRMRHNSFHFTRLKTYEQKKQPILEFLSATDHKKKSLIDFKSQL